MSNWKKCDFCGVLAEPDDDWSDTPDQWGCFTHPDDNFRHDACRACCDVMRRIAMTRKKAALDSEDQSG